MRWTCIILLAVVVVLALIILVPLFIERVDQWSGWQSGEWAAAGAWLGGTMTFFAVSVAVWQTNNANRQARAAEKRADDMQDEIRVSRVRGEEIDAVRDICSGADLFINSVRRYYDVTGAYAAKLHDGESQVSLVSAQADMADSISEAFRRLNMAAVRLESEQLIVDYLSLTSELIEIKLDVLAMQKEVPAAGGIKIFINTSVEAISKMKDRLYVTARKTHSTTDIFPIIERMQKEADGLYAREQAAASQANPTAPPHPKSPTA